MRTVQVEDNTKMDPKGSRVFRFGMYTNGLEYGPVVGSSVHG